MGFQKTSLDGGGVGGGSGELHPSFLFWIFGLFLYFAKPLSRPFIVSSLICSCVFLSLTCSCINTIMPCIVILYDCYVFVQLLLILCRESVRNFEY